MPTSRDKESGFALLLVFLMAAIVAISLYSEIPRVAFQSQRQKEQLLVERGEQYKRAVQVFVDATKGYPRTLDDLEKFQNRRFLRHKYVDPMTGKAEWRVIHVGPGGIPIDSALNKNSTKEQTSSGSSAYITALAGIGQDTGASGQQGGRPQDRRRASEGGGVSGDNMPPGSTPEQPDESPNPGTQASTGAQPTGGTAGVPADAGGATPGQGATTGNPPQASGGGQPMPGIALPGQSPNPAVQIIQNQLAGPNPRAAQTIQLGLAGGAGAGSGAPGSAASGGSGGVGGIASTSEMEGIMVYNDLTTYDKWEFLFDPNTVIPIPAIGAAGQSSPLGLPASPGANQPFGSSPSTTRTATSGGGRGSGSQSATGDTQGGSGRGAGAPTPNPTVSNLPKVRMGRP